MGNISLKIFEFTDWKIRIIAIVNGNAFLLKVVVILIKTFAKFQFRLK